MLEPTPRLTPVVVPWEVQRLKIDDGCYEIHGKDAQGRAFKAKIDPQTLKVVRIKYKDHYRNRERDQPN